jgi:hypothetical protein
MPSVHSLPQAATTGGVLDRMFAWVGEALAYSARGVVVVVCEACGAERPRSPPPATSAVGEQSAAWPIAIAIRSWLVRKIESSPALAHSRPTQAQRGACVSSGSAVHVYLGNARQTTLPEEARQSNVGLPVLETAAAPWAVRTQERRRCLWRFGLSRRGGQRLPTSHIHCPNRGRRHWRGQMRHARREASQPEALGICSTFRPPSGQTVPVGLHRPARFQRHGAGDSDGK